jgi:hypothetical protein
MNSFSLLEMHESASRWIACMAAVHSASKCAQIGETLLLDGTACALQKWSRAAAAQCR